MSLVISHESLVISHWQVTVFSPLHPAPCPPASSPHSLIRNVDN
ncbi:hypothetical protein NSP_44580 [Nodularia spumigena CCY9414]|nr:hypothetical protein NSP_44580 [Nodularia spumigena CCY9414]